MQITGSCRKFKRKNGWWVSFDFMDAKYPVISEDVFRHAIEICRDSKEVYPVLRDGVIVDFNEIEEEP